MSRGFVTLGGPTLTKINQILLCPALRIQAIDKDAEVCMVVDKDKFDEVGSTYKEAFDYITELLSDLPIHVDGFQCL